MDQQQHIYDCLLRNFPNFLLLTWCILCFWVCVMYVTRFKLVSNLPCLILHQKSYSVIDCGTPEQVPGANLYSYTNTLFGSTFNFSCQSGSILSGESVNGDYRVTCQENGQWSFGNLTCTGWWYVSSCSMNDKHLHTCDNGHTKEL